MSQQRVCIRKARIDLDGSLEELDRRFMVLLKTVAVADNTPGLRCVLVGFSELTKPRKI